MSLRVYVSFDLSSNGAKSKGSLSLKIGENNTSGNKKSGNVEG